MLKVALRTVNRQNSVTIRVRSIVQRNLSWRYPCLPRKHRKLKNFIKLIEKAPFTPEEKTKWQDSLQEFGLTEELANEIHEKLSALATESFSSDWEKARFSMDLAAILRQWRMSQGSKQFKHNR